MTTVLSALSYPDRQYYVWRPEHIQLQHRVRLLGPLGIGQHLQPHPRHHQALKFDGYPCLVQAGDAGKTTI